MRLRSAAALLLCLSMTSGCGVPGSATGRVGLAASVDALPNLVPQSLSVTLPAAYGLGGMDELFGEPEDYGHKTQIVVVALKDNAFTADFPVLYHIGFWFIPPLGPIPDHPPAPIFFVQIPDGADEVYAIGMVGDRIEYRVFDKGNRAEKALRDGNWIVEGQEYEPTETGDGEIWYLRVRFVRNAP